MANSDTQSKLDTARARVAELTGALETAADLKAYQKAERDLAEARTAVEFLRRELGRDDERRREAGLARLAALTDACAIARLREAIADDVAAVVAARRAERDARVRLDAIAAEHDRRASEAAALARSLGVPCGIDSTSAGRRIRAEVLSADHEGPIGIDHLRAVAALLECNAILAVELLGSESWSAEDQIGAMLDGSWNATAGDRVRAREAARRAGAERYRAGQEAAHRVASVAAQAERGIRYAV